MAMTNSSRTMLVRTASNRSLSPLRSYHSALRPVWASRCLWPLLLLLLVLEVEPTVSVAGLRTAPADASQPRLADAGVLPVHDVQCSCGKNMSKELTVLSAESRFCTELQARRPRALRGKGSAGRSPLVIKSRRAGKESRLQLLWDLQYISRKRRSRISGVHLHFTRSKRKGKTIIRSDSCFRVEGPPKECLHKIMCTARYLKKRVRRMALRLLYHYEPAVHVTHNSLGSLAAVSDSAPPRQKASPPRQKAYAVQTTLRRRGSGSKRSKGRKRRTRRRKGEKGRRAGLRSRLAACKDWIPKPTLSAKGDHVTVNFAPVNRFASEIVLSLQRVGSQVQLHTTAVFKNVTRYTFTNVEPGTYALSLHPRGPECSGVNYRVSSDTVTVTDTNDDYTNDGPTRTKRHKHVLSCEDWLPKVILHSEGDSVHLSYSPINLFASKIEVALQEDGDSRQISPTLLSNELTNYTFKNVKPGTYKVSLRAHGLHCNEARYIVSKDIVSVTDMAPENGPMFNPPPICYQWNATVQAYRIDAHDSWCLVEVDVEIPPNLVAKDIEISLEEIDSQKFIVQNFIKADPQNRTVVLNVSMNSDKTYQALVRPFGCTDCPDFTQYREECWASYSIASIGLKPPGLSTGKMSTSLSSPGSTKAAGIMVDSRSEIEAEKISTSSNIPESDSPMDRPTVTVHQDTTPSTMRWSEKTIILAILVTCVAIVAVVAVAILLIGKCCRKTDPDMATTSETERLHTNDMGTAGTPDTGSTPPTSSIPTVPKTMITPTSHASQIAYLQPNVCTDNNWSFIQGYNVMNRTHRKTVANTPYPRPTSVSLSPIVFIVYQKESDSDATLLSRLASVMRSLPRAPMCVKVDHECRMENQEDVIGWASDILRVCTKVVVILSPNFLRICQSYQRSRCQMVNSHCAYTDIAPMVMKHLATKDFSDTVFVHFGFDQAKQDWLQLLQLYLYPNSSLHGANFHLVNSDEPVSNPTRLHADRTRCTDSGPVISHFRHSDPNHIFPCQCIVCRRQNMYEAATSHRLPLVGAEETAGVSLPDIQPPPYTTIDNNANRVSTHVCSTQADGCIGNDVFCWCQTPRTRRHRFHSAPQQTGHVPNCEFVEQRPRHNSEPAKYRVGCRIINPALSGLPPYSTMCPHCLDCPTIPKRPHNVFETDSSHDSDRSTAIVNQSPSSSYSQHPVSVPDPLLAVPSTDHSVALHEARACAEIPVGTAPSLVSLQTLEELKRFLQHFCSDEQAIDTAVAGRAGLDFLSMLKGQNLRIPEEHSCCSSMAGSRLNIASGSSDTDLTHINTDSNLISDTFVW